MNDTADLCLVAKRAVSAMLVTSWPPDEAV